MRPHSTIPDVLEIVTTSYDARRFGDRGICEEMHQ